MVADSGIAAASSRYRNIVEFDKVCRRFALLLNRIKLHRTGANKIIEKYIAFLRSNLLHGQSAQLLHSNLVFNPFPIHFVSSCTFCVRRHNRISFVPPEASIIACTHDTAAIFVRNGTTDRTQVCWLSFLPNCDFSIWFRIVFTLLKNVYIFRYIFLSAAHACRTPYYFIGNQFSSFTPCVLRCQLLVCQPALRSRRDREYIEVGQSRVDIIDVVRNDGARRAHYPGHTQRRNIIMHN